MKRRHFYLLTQNEYQNETNEINLLRGFVNYAIICKFIYESSNP